MNAAADTDARDIHEVFSRRIQRVRILELPRYENWYCHGWRCLRTTPHIRVWMRHRIYYYCVVCSRRLEVVTSKELPVPKPRKM